MTQCPSLADTRYQRKPRCPRYPSFAPPLTQVNTRPADRRLTPHPHPRKTSTVLRQAAPPPTSTRPPQATPPNHLHTRTRHPYPQQPAQPRHLPPGNHQQGNGSSGCRCAEAGDIAGAAGALPTRPAELIANVGRRTRPTDLVLECTRARETPQRAGRRGEQQGARVGPAPTGDPTRAPRSIELISLRHRRRGRQCRRRPWSPDGAAQAARRRSGPRAR